MDILLTVLALGLLAFLVFVALVVRGVRVARRHIDRGVREARRSFSDATLRARGAQPGPMGELARLRREMRLSLEHTRKVLESGAPEDPALAEALALVDRLGEHAGALDREMGALMDHEPDRARVAERLPDLRDRAGRIRNSADSLRGAALDRVRYHDAAEIDGLHRQIEIETGALRHWDPVRPAPEPTEEKLPPAPGRRRLTEWNRPRDAR
ncbi:hypothetical protein [Streptomyces alkaliphilus]|uniref:hypothetical protein n=1 Tax=Streptomyces alkaliphilus TaxID=1472722 RepID=UPI0015F9DE4D|nr:hypothetical protein [Streptomyces alkaliphilus]